MNEKFAVFAAACVLGTVAHFLYAILKNPVILSPFLPVSESPWEHFKMAFWPLCASMIYLGIRASATVPQIICSAAAACAAAFFVMFGIFYIYNSGFGVGHAVLAVDIASFYITMVAGFLAGLFVLKLQPSFALVLLCAAALIFTAGFFVYASKSPPKAPIFTSGEGEN